MTAGWLVMSIGQLRLALPQREAFQIELAADLETSALQGQEVGRFRRRTGEPWAAYSLDPDLRVERPAPAERHLCVFFGTRQAARGILCSRVSSLAADGDLRVEPQPGCMAGPRSPAIGLARLEDGVAVVTSAAALDAYLDYLEEAD